MTLEVLRAAGPGGEKRPFDIVLVHGISVGAWVWEETFLPYLARAGFNVHAVSLTGHGESCGRERLSHLTLHDYTSDLAEVAKIIGRPIVAVGHSMGGAVVQSAISCGTALAGAALLASVPPGGLMASNFQMMWQRPRLWRELSGMFTTMSHQMDFEVLRDGLFSSRIDKAAFARFAARNLGESAIIGFELQGMRPFAPSRWKAPPMFVLGGTEDRLIRLDDLHATASWYGVEAEIVDGLSHTVMLDPDWRIAADRLIAWLESLT